MTLSHSPIPGMKLMLLGPPGSGKTSAIRSWLTASPVLGASSDYKKSGLTVFALFTEPSFEVVGDIPDEHLHWVYVPPTSIDWTTMLSNAERINQLDFQALSQLKDLNKAQYREFITVLSQMNNFTCQRCGKSFGSVDKWGTDKVLFFDSLSGLNLMAMNLVVGAKPAKSMSDWGVAMDNEERFVQKLLTDSRCHVTMTAHVERETDENTGQSVLMAATLGRKLAPRLPRFFSDVVLARQSGGKFTWSTTAAGVDLKARNLPFADNLAPDIGPMLANWKSRGGIIEQEEPK